jgi:hypothetical protein
MLRYEWFEQIKGRAWLCKEIPYSPPLPKNIENAETMLNLFRERIIQPAYMASAGKQQYPALLLQHATI